MTINTPILKDNTAKLIGVMLSVDERIWVMITMLGSQYFVDSKMQNHLVLSRPTIYIIELFRKVRYFQSTSSFHQCFIAAPFSMEPS